MRENRNGYRMFLMVLLQRLKSRLENNTKKDLKGTSCKNGRWIELAHDYDQWQGVLLSHSITTELVIYRLYWSESKLKSPQLLTQNPINSLLNSVSGLGHETCRKTDTYLLCNENINLW
jgi:hypothetical protein